MKQVSIHCAKTHLSRLLEEVSAGEEITIAKAGKPLAKLVPLTATEPAPARIPQRTDPDCGRLRPGTICLDPCSRRV